MPYPKARAARRPESDPLPSQPSFPAVEEDVLAYWQEDGTFEASVRAREPGRDGANEFVFYDGPPFANGLPHYGHLLTGYVKDVVPRYQTMRGGVSSGASAGTATGCRRSSRRRSSSASRTRTRSTDGGRRVQRGTAARRYCATPTSGRTTSPARRAGSTSTTTTRRSTWTTWRASCGPSSQLWDKGLIYEGYRVLWYCWRCETPLSNTETRMDDVYKQRQDPAVTVG